MHCCADTPIYIAYTISRAGDDEDRVSKRARVLAETLGTGAGCLARWGRCRIASAAGCGFGAGRGFDESFR